MPKKAIPMSIHKQTKNKHFSGAEIAAREEAEIKLGNSRIVASPVCSTNIEAYSKWRWLIQLYKNAGLDIVTSSDRAILERYCLAWSDYKRLRRTINALQELYDWDDSGVLYLEAYDKLRIDTKLYKVSTELTKLETQLFLTPASKARTIAPTRPKAEKTEIEKAGFDV